MAARRSVCALFLLSSLGVMVQAISPLAASPQGVNSWFRAQARTKANRLDDLGHQRVLAPPKSTPFHELYFQQPLDHFSSDAKNGSGVTFGQRYWANHRHYVEGGPVIVLDGGESIGEERLPFLDYGIADILANATKGLAIVLEHRYYGKSIPVKDFSTDSMRFLNNAQALEDSARFMLNFKWNGTDLSAPKTKWIYYGGSYAGGRAAHMRILYPDLVHGAIASSAAVHATIDNWEYMDTIRTTANQTCTGLLTEAVAHIDWLLSNKVSNSAVKALFGLRGISDADFAGVIFEPLGLVQEGVWDQKGDENRWNWFCNTLGSRNANSLNPVVRTQAVLVNYADFIKEEVVKYCEGSIEECFGSDDDAKFRVTGLENGWRAWVWQVCTEWGFFIGAPPDKKYPTIVSRHLTLDYTSKICHQAFPAGNFAQIPRWPNVSVVNDLGGFDIAMDRLAFVDGDQDPWQPIGPHSRYARNRDRRADTITRPFKWIRTGIHHHDEFGLKDRSLEPAHIREIHAQEVEWVKAWLKD